MSEKFLCKLNVETLFMRKIWMLLVFTLSFSNSIKSFSQVSLCSTVGKVNLISVKRIGQNHGLVTFSLEDEAGNSLSSDISPEEISLSVNGNEVCNKEISHEGKSVLDLIIAVDVSKSMDAAIFALQEGLPNLIDKIGEKFDAHAQIVTFGYGNYNDCNFNFGDNPKLLNVDDDFLINSNYADRTVTNTRSYNYEGYYSMLMKIADYPYDYRPLAQKVIIMIGNESAYAPSNKDGISDPNNVDCETGEEIDSKDVINALEGFQVFVINDKDGFTDIVNATGGSEFPVYPTNYSETVLPAISAKMTTTYTMHFEFCEQKPNCDNEVPVTLEICNKKSSIRSKLDYEPSINRSNETVALDNSGVSKNQNVNISFSVDYSDCRELEYAEIVYSYINEEGVTQEEHLKSVSNGNVFSFTIPAEKVNPDKIEYYIRVNFTDGHTVSSSPISMGVTGYTWTIPVKDASAPTVSHPIWSGNYIYPCGDKQVCAEIVDSDGSVTEAYFLYSDYVPGVDKYTFANSVRMSTDDEINYCATLPAEAGSANGLVYYIYAKDNDGLKGYYKDNNGNESYLSLEYQKLFSDQTEMAEIVISDDCANQFEEDEYVVVYYEGCNGALVSAGELKELSNEWGNFIEVSVNTSDIYQNGVKEGQPIYVALYKETTDGRFVSSKYVKVDELESFMTIEVCPDGDVDEMISVISESDLKIKNGQIVPLYSKMAFPMPKPMPPLPDGHGYSHLRSFDIVNDSKSESDWIINSMKIVPSNNFTIFPEVKDSVVKYGKILSFVVLYDGDDDAEADLYIYNNTLTDPMVIHLVAEKIEKCGDILNFSQDNNIGIYIDGNQEYVEFKTISKDGSVIDSYDGYLGHGLQNRPVSTKGMEEYYVQLTMNGKTCVEEVKLNNSDFDSETPKQNEYDDCGNVINHITTDYVTMADIHVEKESVVYMEVLNMNGTPTGRHYGPDMNHAADHNHYLGGSLPPNTYILKVVIDNKVCSSTFMVK